MNTPDPPDLPDPADAASTRPPRRPRYPGTHPRRFDEKYKERDPEAHPDTVAKVLASGKTPAGTHRPICVGEILRFLAPRPGEIGLDATLGAGGHSLELAPHVRPGGRLIGLDTDPLELPRAEARLRAAGFGPDAFVAIHSNFAALPKVLSSLGVESVHFVVADLGCSSMQLDDPSRGFSHKKDGPLDLRMNPQRGAPASALLARLDADELEALLRDASDEPRARAIAAAIVSARSVAPLETTSQLSAAIAAGTPRGGDLRGARARVFQALRIAVNDEFATLESFLRSLPWCLAPGGRAAILSFHSGEDRRVKQAFAQGSRVGLYEEISSTVIRPSRDEVAANPRASSAKLRWARRSAL